MFNFLKRGKDKEQAEEIIPWGMPSKQKMSKEEAARDEAEQRLIEKTNKERRDTYRLAGNERIFNDSDGRRLSIRLEDNIGPTPNPEHPPVCAVVFWGVRELGHVNAELVEDKLRFRDYVVERGYQGRGIAAELLGEMENFARQNRLTSLVCAAPAATETEWTLAFFTQNGFSLQNEQMVKAL